MTTLLVTLRATGASVDVSVPATIPLGHLAPPLPALVGCKSTRWRVLGPEGIALDRDRCLADLGILDGAVLTIVTGDEDVVPPGPTGAPIGALERSSQILPPRMGSWHRARLTVRATTGGIRPPGTRSPIERAMTTWRWTDFNRRLEWMVGRPRRRAGLIIGVVGVGSLQLAAGLAETFRRHRSEPVVAIDAGAAPTPLVRPPPPLAPHWAVPDHPRRRIDAGSMEPAGLADCLGAAAADERTTVVVDWGRLPIHPRLLDTCHQIVQGAEHPYEGRHEGKPADRRTVVAGWTEGEDTLIRLDEMHGEGWGLTSVVEDAADTALLRVAVLLAAAWADLGISSPLPWAGPGARASGVRAARQAGTRKQSLDAAGIAL